MMVNTRADHLIFLSFDLENLRGEGVYNGPEHDAIALLKTPWVGQRMVSMTRIRLLDAAVAEERRLPMVLSQRTKASARSFKNICFTAFRACSLHG